MTNNIGEFKGTTKEAIKDIRGDIKEMKDDIKGLNKRFWVLLIIGTVALIERLPDLITLALAN